METDHHEREVRAARNQALFRAVNEQIRKVNDSFAELTASFSIACECFDAECVAMIEIEPPAYERVRSSPHHFAVLPGHVHDDVERVIEETDTYVVVEKIGVAADVVEALDPRTA